MEGIDKHLARELEKVEECLSAIKQTVNNAKDGNYTDEQLAYVDRNVGLLSYYLQQHYAMGCLK